MEPTKTENKKVGKLDRIFNIINHYDNTLVSEFYAKCNQTCQMRFQFQNYQLLEKQKEDGKLSRLGRLGQSLSDKPIQTEIDDEEQNIIHNEYQDDYFKYCSIQTTQKVRKHFAHQIENFTLCKEDCYHLYPQGLMSFFYRHRCNRICEDQFNSAAKLTFNNELTQEEKNQFA